MKQHRPRTSLHLLTGLSSSLLPLLVGCSGDASGDSAQNTGTDFQEIVYVVRQHTMTDAAGNVRVEVAGGMGQVMDYRRYVPGARIEVRELASGDTRNILAGAEYAQADVVGLDLSFDGVTYGTYDASRYDGITFYARAGRPYTEFHLRVNTTDSTFVGYGGTCQQEFCDTYAFYSWSLGVEWARYSVLFTELHAYIGNRGLPEFHRERLTNVQFLFVRYRPPYPDTEIWIDDVLFFRGAKPAN